MCEFGGGGEIIFFTLVYGKIMHSLGFVIMFRKVLFSHESGKQVFSEVIKLFSSQFLSFTRFYCFLHMYVMKKKTNNKPTFHGNLEKDGSTWKIIGITDFLPAIPLKSAMKKQIADYFPSLFMLPKELQVRSNIIMNSVKKSFTLPHKLRRVKPLLEGQDLKEKLLVSDNQTILWWHSGALLTPPKLLEFSSILENYLN